MLRVPLQIPDEWLEDAESEESRKWRKLLEFARWQQQIAAQSFGIESMSFELKIVWQMFLGWSYNISITMRERGTEYSDEHDMQSQLPLLRSGRLDSELPPDSRILWLHFDSCKDIRDDPSMAERN